MGVRLPSGAHSDLPSVVLPAIRLYSLIVKIIKDLFARIKALVLIHKKLSLLFLAILIAAGYFLFPKGGPTVLTQAAKTEDVIRTVSVTGNVDSDNTVNLTFQTAGTLDYLGIKVGDTVKKGQLIASLNKDDLWAAFRQAQQDFTAAKAASEQYYSGHTNATESYDEKVQRTALDAAQNKAYDNMVIAQKAIANSNLYSTIDGIVTKADAQSAGVNITVTTTFTITDPTSLNFKMEVDEADIGQVKIGQNVNVSLDSFPNDNLKLIVDKIDFVSHLTSSGGNAFYVKANLPENSAYRVGMNGNADIIVGEAKNVLAIPSSSIFDDNYVYVKQRDKFEKKKIRLGLQSDTEAEVKSGLLNGDIVAVDPSSVPSNLIIKTK